MWNYLLVELRNSPSKYSFKKHRKTYTKSTGLMYERTGGVHTYNNGKLNELEFEGLSDRYS